MYSIINKVRLSGPACPIIHPHRSTTATPDYGGHVPTGPDRGSAEDGPGAWG